MALPHRIDINVSVAQLSEQLQAVQGIAAYGGNNTFASVNCASIGSDNGLSPILRQAII